MNLVLLMAGLVLGCLICYFALQPKIKNTSRIKEEIKMQNDELDKENENLKQKNEQLRIISVDLANKKDKHFSILQEIEKNRGIAEVELSQLQKRIEETDKSTEEIYQRSLSLIQEKLDRDKEKAEKQYRQAKESCEEEYEATLADCANELSELVNRKLEEVNAVSAELQAWKAKQTAILEAQRKEEERKLDTDKYRILLTSADLTEIAHLREVVPFLRNPRCVYKIIWETYFRTPLNDTIKRVLPELSCCGIYKLEDLSSRQIYIGQSVDVRKRWIDHCKAGLGIDASSNKLYRAMSANGVENFSFELLEQCPKEELNNREKFYIDYYQSVEYGLNEKAGGARL